MAMHRLMGSFDCLPVAADIHWTAVGVSTGSPVNLLINAGGILGFWKMNWNIHMGMIHTRPMALGHDAGPPRAHILIVIPDPTQATSIAASIAATALAGIKLPFTAHKVQISVGGSSLPVCCQPIPWTPSFFAAQVCGNPDLPNGVYPIIPTHLSVYAGLTCGDIIGGIVNLVVDMIVSAVMGKAGDAISDVSKIASNVFGVVTRGLGVVGLSFGPTNLGGLVQQWIDDDGVGSDAEIAIRPLPGTGVRIANPDGDPSWDDLEFTHPGSTACAPWSL